MSYLFVYGTLRNDAKHDIAQHLSRGARLAGTGYIQAKLYDLGEYPGAIPSSNPHDKVYGQVFEILDESIFPALDDYEGCGPQDTPPYEFKRERVKITSSIPSLRYAWTYLYARPIHSNRLIQTGDYVKAT